MVITSDNVLVIGHGRRLAALQIGCEMPYHVIDKTADELTDEDIRELRIADNQTNAETGTDWDTLEAELADLSFDGFDFDFDFGGGDEDAPDDEAPNEYEEQKERKGSMAEKYLVPPFSVIYANRPDWLARKRAWVERGLHSEIGRAGALAFNSKSDPEANFANRGGYNDKRQIQSVQKQYDVKQLRSKAKAYSDGLLTRQREYRRAR